jgi:hypothetical protein
VESEGSAVAIGIDAAVVADHHVMVRRRDTQGPGTIVDEFKVPPTLAGMEKLAKKLSAYPGALAVAEPTSMTWRHWRWAWMRPGARSPWLATDTRRACGAVSGKNESDVIDTEMLSHADELFGLAPARIPGAGELTLRRAVLLRHGGFRWSSQHLEDGGVISEGAPLVKSAGSKSRHDFGVCPA